MSTNGRTSVHPEGDCSMNPLCRVRAGSIGNFAFGSSPAGDRLGICQSFCHFIPHEQTHTSSVLDTPPAQTTCINAQNQLFRKERKGAGGRLHCPLPAEMVYRRPVPPACT